MENLTKKEAEKILLNGGKVYLDNKDDYIKSIGLSNDVFCDNKGFLLTNWFYLYAPKNGYKEIN